jgi:hypothetical protein
MENFKQMGFPFSKEIQMKYSFYKVLYNDGAIAGYVFGKDYEEALQKAKTLYNNFIILEIIEDGDL